MAEIKKDGMDYIGYEYKNREVAEEYVSLYLDSYPCFGWEEDPNQSVSPKAYQMSRTMLHFRRDRKICNKMELTRLQRNFDACVSEMEQLERSKTTKATIVALLIGIVGCAFMAGSVFAVSANTPMIALCIILAVPGFFCWIFPYYVYRELVRRRTLRVEPMIEDKMNEIYEVCESGRQLLM